MARPLIMSSVILVYFAGTLLAWGSGHPFDGEALAWGAVSYTRNESPHPTVWAMMIMRLAQMGGWLIAATLS